MEWEVVVSEVDSEYPDIATSVRSAINGTDTFMRGDSYARVCLKAACAADKQADPRQYRRAVGCRPGRAASIGVSGVHRLYLHSLCLGAPISLLTAPRALNAILQKAN